MFASGIDITMVGLDVTHKALFTTAHVGRLAGRVGEMVTELLRFYGTFHRDVYGFDGSPIHDAVAVAHVMRPELVETLHRNVEIDVESELCRGRTVVDLWQRTDRTPNTHVGVDIDADGFLELLIERERTTASHGQHARQLPATQTNEVSVFCVEFVHQTMRGRSLMLRNLIDERFVIQAMDRFEFPIFGRSLEYQRSS